MLFNPLKSSKSLKVEELNYSEHMFGFQEAKKDKEKWKDNRRIDITRIFEHGIYTDNQCLLAG